MNRYVFYISAPQWGDASSTIYLDTFHKLKSNLDAAMPVTEGLLKLLGDEHDIVQTAKEDGEVLHKMGLRQRYAMSEGPFMVLVDADITREGLEALLTTKLQRGTLKTFLKEASLKRAKL